MCRFLFCCCGSWCHNEVDTEKTVQDSVEVKVDNCSNLSAAITQQPNLNLNTQSKPDNTPITENIKLNPKPKPAPRTAKNTNLNLKQLKAQPSWLTCEILRDNHNITLNTAKQLEALFTEGNTVPFIARHRKDVIGSMTTEELRNLKNTYDKSLALRQDIHKKHEEIMELGVMSETLHLSLIQCKTKESLEQIFMPYKEMLDKKASTEREAFVALETTANLILKGQQPSSTSVTTNDVLLIQLVARKISSTSACLDLLQDLCTNAHCTMRTTQLKRIVKQNKDNFKFKNYIDRSFDTNNLQPHQILAINRAEKRQLIVVTLVYANFSTKFIKIMKQHFEAASTGPMVNVFDKSLDFCYNNIALPMLKQMKRQALNVFAEQAALEVYSDNLKHLLLTPPVRNIRILGVDPGTSLGCKLGMINEFGDVLDTGVVYPNSNTRQKRQQQKQILRKMLQKHNCSLIAIGNGTGCRDAEMWIADMIKTNYFDPLKVSYLIVNENGASIYSCSQEAIREFKTMDPILIGAVSLARRVQDPLSELVKVEPRHMGIGMYQHDVDPIRLERVLADVVCECVSFVGVDINTASECLLRHVAGLSTSLASEIVAYRKQNGDFTQRKEIYKVRGINTLTYKQCAGFLKILNGVDKLDETKIHPESYDLVKRITKKLKMRMDQIGTGTYRAKVKEQRSDVMIRHKALGTSRERLEVILDGLTEEGDMNGVDSKPKRLYRSDVMHMNQLRNGIKLTGAVVNVTTFGSFIDVGVEVAGLVHTDNAKSVRLCIGDRVQVEVCSLNFHKRRIGLKLVRVL